MASVNFNGKFQEEALDALQPMLSCSNVIILSQCSFLDFP